MFDNEDILWGLIIYVNILYLFCFLKCDSFKYDIVVFGVLFDIVSVVLFVENFLLINYFL